MVTSKTNNGGQEFVYTEGVVGDFVSSIKKFLLKIWDKIKALFKRFIMLFDSYTKTDKEFVNKYRDQIYTGKNLSDFSFKGYRFKIEDSTVKRAIEQCKSISKTESGVEDKGDEDIDRKQENISDRIEEIRGDISKTLGGAGGKLDQSEFTKEVHEALRGGMSSKEDISDIKLNEIVGYLTGSSDTKKIIDTAFRESKRSIDDDIKIAERSIRDSQKGLGKKETSDDEAKTANTHIKNKNYQLGLIRATKTILVALDGQILQALKDRSRQSKAILIKIVHHNPKNESSVSEGWQHSDMTQANFLSGIEFK